jgi:hypothetical protein
LVATAATVVAFSVAASVASAAVIYCQGAACGPSGTQAVTPTNVALNDNTCPAGTTRVTFSPLANSTPGQVLSQSYNFGGQSGSVIVTLSSDNPITSFNFTVTGGALAVQVNVHGGQGPAGSGGVNSTNIYNYSGKTNGGVSGDTALRFPGPLSDIFVCLKNGPVLAVTTSSFNARYTGRSVTVRWRTASEANVLGFNVYRVSHGQRVKLNKRLIPSANVLHGKSTSAYSFRTRLASKRLAASSRYLLQEVHTNGSRTNYGPIRARNAA